MRVLHVYSGNLYGGIEAVLATIARTHDVQDLESEFALCFAGRLSDELIAAGARVHELGAVRMRQPASLLRARHRLRHMLRERKPDVVICHAFWAQALFGRTTQRARVPQVLWQHDAATGRHWTERWARRTRPALVICNSAFSQGTLQNLYEDVPSDVVCYPVAAAAVMTGARRAAIRNELGVRPEDVVIIQVARMEPWKGQLRLLRALALMSDAEWRCWIVGGPQRDHEKMYMEKLETLSAEPPLRGRIHLLGERSDARELLRAADLLCQPSVTPEPFGVAIIEAMYAGLPVVVSDVGGPAEVVDRTCGFRVEPDDTEALARALGDLVADAALRARFSAAAPARARELCDPPRQLARLQAVLKRAIGAAEAA
jgi:glycosyltransferase involved in cell wall biosynthesis